MKVKIKNNEYPRNPLRKRRLVLHMKPTELIALLWGTNLRYRGKRLLIGRLQAV
jgi:hypothetical protein